MNWLRLFTLFVSGSLIAGCVSELESQWTVNSQTSVSSFGHISKRALEVAAIPEPAIAATCGGGIRSAEGTELAIRPGVGSRVRIHFWSGLEDNSERQSYSLPSAIVFDGVLRLAPANGTLDPDERALLATFLLVHRRNPLPADVQSLAREALESQEVDLWNELVRTMCVEVARVTYVNSQSTTVATQRTLVFKSDLIALCNIVEPKRREAFARFFIDTAASLDRGRCTGVSDGSLIGSEPAAGQTNNWQSLVSAQGRADDSGPFYAPDQHIKIADLGDLTFQRPRFGTRGTEAWTLEDWQASGICRDQKQDADRPVIDRLEIRGGQRLNVIYIGSPQSRIVRTFTSDGPTYLLETPSGKPVRQFTATISASDLRLLSPRDVRGITWKKSKDSSAIVHPSCSQTS